MRMNTLTSMSIGTGTASCITRTRIRTPTFMSTPMGTVIGTCTAKARPITSTEPRHCTRFRLRTTTITLNTTGHRTTTTLTRSCRGRSSLSCALCDRKTLPRPLLP